MNFSPRRSAARTPHAQFHRFATAAALAGALLAVVAAEKVVAQALMVGADGAIHLDAFEEVQANDPVIIQQSPELVGPSLGEPSLVGPTPSMVGGAPLSFAADAQAYNACNVPFVPYTPMAATVMQQPLPIKYSFFGEFLYLHPTGVDVTHAQQQVLPGVPLGQLGATDFHYEPGVRIGGDMAMSPTTSIAASYTYFESNAVNSLAPPTVNGVAGTVGSLVLFPPVGVLPSTGALDARSVFDFQLADAEYRARLKQGEKYWINGGLGLRYGRLEQSFGQTGVFPVIGEIDTQATVDFDGGGVKLALDGGRNIGHRGFSFYGRTSLSPLAGEFRSTYSMFDDTLDATLVQANWKDDRLTTLLDYEVGLAWTGPRRRWRMAAGYTQSFWFNAVTTSDYIGAVQNGNYSGVSDTIMLNGLTARVEHLW